MYINIYDIFSFFIFLFIYINLLLSFIDLENGKSTKKYAPNCM